MSQLNVDNIRNRTGSNGGPNFPSGITVAVGQTAYIHGNLQVDGTETIINTETLNVSDKTVGIGSTSNASNTTADGSGIEIFASSSQTGNNKTITWSNTSNSWEFGPNDVGLKVGTGITVYGETGIVSATSFKGDGSELTGIDATALKDGSGSVKIQANSDGVVITGVATVGVLSATTLYGSGANLTNLPPGGNVIEAVANGSIANNKAVKIDTDGKVSEIKEVTSPVTTLVLSGSPQGLNSGQNDYRMKAINCGTDKVLGIYVDGTNGDISAKVGYHSGSNDYPSWGTEANIPVSGGNWNVDYGRIEACYIGSNKVFIAFSSNGSIRCYIATVNTSNNTVTFGSETAVSGNNRYPAVSYDPDLDNVLLIWNSAGSSDKGFAAVMTWSGTTITANTSVEFPRISSHNGVNEKNVCYDTNVNKHIVMFDYKDYGNRGYVVSVSVSGTTPTFGTLVQFCGSGLGTDALNPNNPVDLDFDPNVNKFVLFYTGGARCWKQVGTCASNGNITVESQSMSLYTHGNNNIWPSIIYEPVSQSFIAVSVTSDGGNWSRYPRAQFFKIDSSGNYTFANSTTIQTEASEFTTVANWGTSPKGKAVVLWAAMANSDGNRNAESQDLNTTAEQSNLTQGRHYIGFADQAYTDGQTATIKTYGNNVDTLSGLTIGSKYWVLGDGTVTTTQQSGAPAALAGLAIGTTKLLIREPNGWAT